VARVPRVLSPRELNRAVLARQLLLERSRAPLPRALERVGGIQAQYAPSMYIGLAARLDGFRRDALTRALERRTVIQATLMRSTIHLVSARDYWPLAVATRDARRQSWRKVYPEPSDVEMRKAARTLRRRLEESPLPRKAIEHLIGKDRFRGVGLWLDLVRAPPSGTWERRRADLFASADDWLGPATIDLLAARELLVRRYLGGFGPALRGDIASWTGVAPADLDPVLERVPLRRFRDRDGAELLDLPRAPLPDPSTPAPVRFLPTWDANLLVHARRAEILPEEYRSGVFSINNPQSVPTLLVDGAVAGTWRYEDGEVRIEAFAPLPRSARREVREESERVAALHV
jgi:hypothetical protein